MYWQEQEKPSIYQVPDDIVDLSFRIHCLRLPVDHAIGLCGALHNALPWMLEEDGTGIHLIHGAETGNGWQRPDNDDYLVLSKRTRLGLRVPKQRSEDARRLCGTTLRVDDIELNIISCKEKPLSTLGTLFSRHVETRESDDEGEFLSECAKQLGDLGITPKKMLCGRLHQLAMPDGPVNARSLMLADLEKGEAVKLQQAGLGRRQAFGMGLFIPHKGIEAVYTEKDDKV